MPLLKKTEKTNTRLTTNLFSSLLACASLQLETYHTKGNNIIWLAKALAQGVGALSPKKLQPPASALSCLSVRMDSPSSRGVL